MADTALNERGEKHSQGCCRVNAVFFSAKNVPSEKAKRRSLLCLVDLAEVLTRECESVYIFVHGRVNAGVWVPLDVCVYTEGVQK